MDPIDYYSKHAGEYYDNTVDLNMEPIMERFIELLPEGSCVMDLGCGSGRDSLYLIENGFDVTALDGSKELCELAKIHIGQDVLNMAYSEMDFENVFDGVWACASLVHVRPDELDDILKKIILSMKPDGVLYLSFKYGEFEGMRGERYFHDFKSKRLKELIGRHEELEVLEIFKTSDVRKGREDELWINLLARKRNREEE